MIGNKSTLVYFPPGYLENPRPDYDVVYAFDLSSFFGYDANAKKVFDDVFADHVEGQVVIGFGDYREDPEVPDSQSVDRTNLLTGVREHCIFLVPQCPGKGLSAQRTINLLTQTVLPCSVHCRIVPLVS